VSRDKKKAFTLLEIVLVMVIMSTMLAIAAPSLRGFFSSRQLRDLAEMITDSAEYARYRAVTEGSGRLVISPQRHLYWVTGRRNSRFVKEDGKSGLDTTCTIPQDIEFDFENVPQDGGLYYIDFDSLGTSEECYIEMTDEKGNGYIVEFFGDSRSVSFRQTEDAIRRKL
jgi:prepilin-type N-terminal cleavage/methylation domain-containing protein